MILGHYHRKVVVETALLLEGSFGRMKALKLKLAMAIDLILQSFFQVIVGTSNGVHDERSLSVYVT